MKFFIRLLVVFFMFDALAFAAPIEHSFTFEGDVGKSRNGHSRGYNLSGWLGNHKDRLWINSEKKNFDNYDEKFEAQALYSRNFAQFWDAQVGVSHDFSTNFTHQNVNYFTIGLEGFKSHSFETRAQAFLSDEGNYSFEIKQDFDIYLSKKIIAKPYVEVEAFAQDVEKLEVRKGISDIETGVVTRYEVNKKMAPYFAIRYHKKTFGTANLARQLGDKTNNFIVAVGLKLWF